MEKDKELVKLLSHTLRMTWPHEYARGLEAGEMMRKEEGLELLFQEWCGVALNEEKTGEWGMVHNDANYYGINCAVPWEV